MAKTKTRTTTFRHQPDLMRRVDSAARRAGVSRNKFIQLVLADYAETKTPKDIRDLALADANQAAAAQQEVANEPDLFD